MIPPIRNNKKKNMPSTLPKPLLIRRLNDLVRFDSEIERTPIFSNIFQIKNWKETKIEFLSS